MANFYNPYSKYPDFGGGVQDVMNQIIQMLMLKQMMGPKTQTERTLGETQPGQPRAGAAMYAQTPGYQQPGQMSQQMSPQLMMMLWNLLQGGNQ